MPGPPAQRAVICCHCSGVVVAAAMARTLTCPLCYQRITLDDIVVTSTFAARTLVTCGRIVVAKRATGTVREARASGGNEVEGAMQADSAATAAHRDLAPPACWG